MKKLDYIKIIAYLYILLPLIVFFLGWTKLVIGIPLTLAMAFCICKMVLRNKRNNVNTIFNKTKIDIVKIVFILLVILIWIYWSGIGGYVWQNLDHYWRNEIFDILVEYEWPVVKGTAYGAKGISYYIGFWMIPALIGKVFGLGAGYFCQYIWAVIGVLLVYALMCRKFQKIIVCPLILFILFSGFDILGLFLFDFDKFLDFTLGTHIETWAVGYQFSSFTTQLFWVYNQAIYAWLITLIVLEDGNNGIVLVMCAGLLEATLPMVGLFPIALVRIYNNLTVGLEKISIEQIKPRFLETCITYENIIGGISTIILATLLLGNNATAATENVATANNSFGRYIIFLVIEIGAYILLTAKAEKNNNIYWTAIIVLIVCPLIVIGEGIDFCMRACIPAQVVLFMSVCKSLRNAVINKNRIVIIFAIICMLIGSVTTTSELYRTVKKYPSYMKKGNTTARKDEIFEAVNFTVDVEDNLFFKYIAR